MGALVEIVFGKVGCFVDAPAELRWGRVQARNREPGHSFEISREMFADFDSRFEAPGPEEGDVLVVDGARARAVECARAGD